MASPQGASRLRVAFDVTPLGRGRFYPRGRTGIFRVTAELALALDRVLGKDLTFVALECRAEAEEALRDAGVSEAVVLRSKLDRALYPWVRKLTVPANMVASRGLSETRRKTFRTLVNALEGIGGRVQPPIGSIDVCHSTFLPVSSLNLPGMPSVVTVHDLLALTHPQYFADTDRENALRVVQDVREGAWAHCISQATRGALLKFAPEAEERSFVAPLAANQTYFRIPEPQQVARFRDSVGLRAAPYFLTVGTLDPRKNLEAALEAFAIVAQTHPHAHLVLVGAPARNKDPISSVLARRESIRNKCHLVGFLPDQELAAAYHGACACLFPSHAEGFGLPILEAMSSGTAVISSNTTSMPEVVGDAGILLSPVDANRWAAAMLELLENDDRRSEWCRLGLRRTAAFSWEKTAALLLTQYAALAGLKGSVA